MTRFINAVLITVVAFILVLAALFAVAGGPPADPDRGGISITAVEPKWGRANQDGTELRIDIRVHNAGLSQARINKVDAVVKVDGVEVARVEAKPDTAILPQGNGVVQVTAKVPAGFAVSWWERHAAADESSTFRIEGRLDAKMPDAARVVPFTWASSWRGHLADGLSQSVACPGETVCPDSVVASWDGSRMRLALVLANPTPYAEEVHQVETALVLGGRHVGTATAPGPGLLGAGQSVTVELELDWDDSAMEAWWTQHVGRCENSPTRLDVTLLTSSGTIPSRHDAPNYQTRMVCNGGR